MPIGQTPATRPVASPTTQQSGGKPPASRCRPGHCRQIAFRKPHGPLQLDAFLCRRPARQRNLLAVEAANPRPMHRNLAAVEADLALTARSVARKARLL